MGPAEGATRWGHSSTIESIPDCATCTAACCINHHIADHTSSRVCPPLSQLAHVQAAPLPTALATGPAPQPLVPSTPCLLLDRMAQDALAVAAAQQGQVHGPAGSHASHWAAAGPLPPAVQQHPGAQPLALLFPQLADSVQQVSQQLQQAREQYGSQLGAPQLSSISTASKQMPQAQASAASSGVATALLKAILGQAAPPQQAQQPPAQLPQQDPNGAAAAADLAKAILANLQQRRQDQPPQQPQAAPQQPEAQPQLQPAVAAGAASGAPSPQPEVSIGGSAAPDTAALLRALLQTHGLQSPGSVTAAAPAAAPAPDAAAAAAGGSTSSAIQRLAALLQPAAAAGVPGAAAPATVQQHTPAVAGSPGS